MFFEDLETRQMFSVSIASAALILPKPPIVATLRVASAPAAAATTAGAGKTPTSIATTPAPSQTSPLKPSVTSAVGSVLQGTLDPAKLGSTPVGAGTTKLPGGVIVSLNPTLRPGKSELAAANGLQSSLAALVNGAMQGLIGQYGKSLSQFALTPGVDPTSGSSDLLNLITSDLQALRALNQTAGGKTAPGGIDSRYADDVAGGLGVDPTDAEVAAAIAARKAKDATGTATTTTTTTAPPATSAWDTVKAVGAAVLDFAKDVVFERLGPPGPGTTLLDAPGYVEKVTGDSKDLTNGIKSIVSSGVKNPNMPKDSADPNGDVVLEPQQRKIIDQAMALFGKMLSLPTFHDLGTTLISQPAQVDGSPIVPKPNRSQLTSGQMPAKNMSTYINPGSGDDGSGAATSGAAGPMTPKAVVKDPPKPDSPDGLNGTGVAPGNGVTQPGVGTVTSNGVKPTNPK